VLPSNNLRVLHFYKTYYPGTGGGVEQFIFQLARGTESFGITSEVLSLSKAKVEEPSTQTATRRIVPEWVLRVHQPASVLQRFCAFLD
jgi:hypothetical protein